MRDRDPIFPFFYLIAFIVLIVVLFKMLDYL